MTSAIHVLHRDHEEFKAMLAELELGPTARSGAGQHQLTLRKQMTEQLIAEEFKHEAAEEEYFWPVVREQLPGGDELADHAARQEQHATDLLHRLDGMDPAEPGFEPLLAEFTGAAREHIAFEEQQVWPELMRVLSPGQLEDLGTKLERGKRVTARAGR